jgi:hypothetical protein
MVRKLLLSIPFLAVFPMLLYGQDKITTMVYEGNMQLVNLKHSGMVVCTANSREITVSRLNEEGELMWETLVPLTFTTNKISRVLFGNLNAENTHFLVASPSGEHTFLVESSADIFSNSSSVKVTHFDPMGETRNFEFENLHHEMGNSFHATFSDDRFLYFLAKGKEKRDPEHRKESTFILNRFDIHNLDYRKINLELPPTYEDKSAKSQWAFLGQYNGEIYLVNKFANLKDNQVYAKVLAINEHGETVKNLELIYSPESGHIRPFHQVQFRDRNVALHETPDYHISRGGPFSSPYRNFRIGAYLDLLLDEESGEFLLSGLLGEKSFGKDPFNYKNQQYSGFYITKFDATGNLEWEMQKKGEDGILSSKDFINRYPPGHKNVGLRLNSDLGFINYTLQVNDILNNYIIDEAGEVVDVKEKRDYTNATDHLAFLPVEYSKVPNYLQSEGVKERELMHASITGKRGEFLMQVDSQLQELKIIFFEYDAFHPRLHRELVEN